MPDLVQLTDLITKAGVIPLLVLGLLVLGREYRRLEKRCDHWQHLALQALSDADRATALADFFKEAP